MGTQETRWIEWKRSLDLTTPAGRFVAAKAILGFANRSPEVAAQTCEGTAYLVVGAEPGRVDGVEAIVDHAHLAQKIKTFADGPRWTPHDIPYEGKTVLVIVARHPGMATISTHSRRIMTKRKRARFFIVALRSLSVQGLTTS